MKTVELTPHDYQAVYQFVSLSEYVNTVHNQTLPVEERVRKVLRMSSHQQEKELGAYQTLQDILWDYRDEPFVVEGLDGVQFEFLKDVNRFKITRIYPENSAKLEPEDPAILERAYLRYRKEYQLLERIDNKYTEFKEKGDLRAGYLGLLFNEQKYVLEDIFFWVKRVFDQLEPNESLERWVALESLGLGLFLDIEYKCLTTKPLSVPVQFIPGVCVDLSDIYLALKKTHPHALVGYVDMLKGEEDNTEEEDLESVEDAECDEFYDECYSERKSALWDICDRILDNQGPIVTAWEDGSQVVCDLDHSRLLLAVHSCDLETYKAVRAHFEALAQAE